jgi:endogenous inhibitor of DNA gyrase (YacG/DUF329 family)
MLEFWDDRAVQVVANTGLTVIEHYVDNAKPLHGDAAVGSEKPCESCGKPLKVTRTWQRFCSSKCRLTNLLKAKPKGAVAPDSSTQGEKIAPRAK